jgi:hypothetical protein
MSTQEYGKTARNSPISALSVSYSTLRKGCAVVAPPSGTVRPELGAGPLAICQCRRPELGGNGGGVPVRRPLRRRRLDAGSVWSLRSSTAQTGLQDALYCYRRSHLNRDRICLFQAMD